MIRTRNWSKFQHYRRRSPPWIKLHRQLLDDFEFARLHDASKALAPLLWLLASDHENGEIDSPIEQILFRLRMPFWKFAQALMPLVKAGFFDVDDDLASTMLAARSHDATPETETETETEAETEGEKEKIKKKKISILASPWTEADRDRFWAEYPNKVGKAAAMKALKAASQKIGPEALFSALWRYSHKTDDRPFCNPATWLNQERWLDEPVIGGVGNGKHETEYQRSKRKTREVLDALEQSGDSSGAPDFGLLPHDPRER